MRWLDKDAEHGLSQELLDKTDVLFWWGHMAHGEVRDEIVDRVQKRVQEGMGLIVLHSGHKSKIFMKMLGTTCNLKWREVGKKSVSGTLNPRIRSRRGSRNTSSFRIRKCTANASISRRPKTLCSSHGTKAAKSSAAASRSNAATAESSICSGHETFPIFYDKNIRKVLVNAAKWAAPRIVREIPCPCVEPLEEIRTKLED